MSDASSHYLVVGVRIEAVWHGPPGPEETTHAVLTLARRVFA